MPQEFIDLKVAQAMGVPYTEIDQVPHKTYMVALTCINAEAKAKQDMAFKAQAQAKRNTRK